MTDWIRLSLAATDDYKIVRLCRLAGEGAFRCLVRLWCRVAMTRPDGVMRGMEAAAVEHMAGWTGEDGALVRALVEVRLLDPLPEGAPGWSVHDWADHQEWVAGADERRDRARRAWEARATKAASRRGGSTPTPRPKPSRQPKPPPAPKPTPVPPADLTPRQPFWAVRDGAPAASKAPPAAPKPPATPKAT